MSFKDPVQSLRDILESARMIEDFIAGMTLEQFREDPRTVAAVERKFLVIGEAAVRLGQDASVIVPDVPWRQVWTLFVFSLWHQIYVEQVHDPVALGWLAFGRGGGKQARFC